MTEGNSCYRGGKPGVSNAFCSALWAADYLLRLASFGCAGVNLHGGSANAIRTSLGGHLPGEQLAPDAAPWLRKAASILPSPAAASRVLAPGPFFMACAWRESWPEAECGRRPSIERRPTRAAWAAEMPDGPTRVILINKHAREQLRISLPAAHQAKLWRLQAPGLTATSEVTLAGAQIKAGTAWQPQSEERPAPRTAGCNSNCNPAPGRRFF